MNIWKILCLSAAALMTFAIVAANSSATTIEIKGVKQNQAVTFTLNLQPGTTLIVKDEPGTTTTTCTGLTLHGKTTEFTTPGTNEIHGNVESGAFSGCLDTTHFVKLGKLYFGWISGTTNARVTWAEAEWQVRSTFFGATATCKTGAGTTIGTFTGSKEGNATMHISATIGCGILGNSSMTGTLVNSSPVGTGFVE